MSAAAYRAEFARLSLFATTVVGYTCSSPQREVQKGSTAARVVRRVSGSDRRTTSNGAQESSLY